MGFPNRGEGGASKLEKIPTFPVFLGDVPKLDNSFQYMGSCPVENCAPMEVQFRLNRSAAKLPQQSRSNLTTLGMDLMIFQAVLLQMMAEIRSFGI